MSWAPEQDRALLAVQRWLESEQQVFRLFGYAGTGKTTLAKSFAEGIDGTVLFGAYTGKAAHVLRQKGCPNATTIHKLIYMSRDKSKTRLRELEQSLLEIMAELPPEERDHHPEVIKLKAELTGERTDVARPFFELNKESPVANAELVVIDECSMVDGSMGQDLLSFGTKVLVLGDPAQLPPVASTGFFTDGVTPNVMLTEIHRQAQDNPILKMATMARCAQELPLGMYGESRVIEKRELQLDEVRAADQILVGRNNTRTASNRRMRNLILADQGIEYQDLPFVDDKLVCLRNNHELGLLNGAIFRVEDVGPEHGDKCALEVRPEDGGPSTEVTAHTQYFRGSGKDLGWWEKKDAEEFDYGYALTVHKAQGSQWDDVLLFDESYVFRADRWKWLYTAITRAAKRLTMVKM